MCPGELGDFVRLMDFLLEGIHNIVVTAGLQLIFEPLQRYADDVAMMQPRSDAGLGA